MEYITKVVIRALLESSTANHQPAIENEEKIHWIREETKNK